MGPLLHSYLAATTREVHTRLLISLLRHGRLVCHALVNLFGILGPFSGKPLTHTRCLCQIVRKRKATAIAREARLDLQGDLNRIISPPSLPGVCAYYDERCRPIVNRFAVRASCRTVIGRFSSRYFGKQIFQLKAATRTSLTPRDGCPLKLG